MTDRSADAPADSSTPPSSAATGRTAVVFDLDGTLLSLPDPYRPVVADALDRLGHPADGAFLEAYDEAFLPMLERLEDDPYRRAAERAAEVADLAVDGAAFEAALLEAECEAIRVREGVPATLDALVDAGHALGVLTNGVTAFQRAKLEGHGLLERFEAVVVSEDVGAHKPDADAFAALEGALPADRYVMVGDSPEADVEGARAVGWDAVHVDELLDVTDPLATLDALADA